jgi:hypothetical protein
MVGAFVAARSLAGGCTVRTSVCRICKCARSFTRSGDTRYRQESAREPTREL